MSKATVTRLFIGSVIAVVAGAILIVAAVWLAIANDVFVMSGPDIVGHPAEARSPGPCSGSASSAASPSSGGADRRPRVVDRRAAEHLAAREQDVVRRPAAARDLQLRVLRDDRLRHRRARRHEPATARQSPVAPTRPSHRRRMTAGACARSVRRRRDHREPMTTTLDDRQDRPDHRRHRRDRQGGRHRAGRHGGPGRHHRPRPRPGRGGRRRDRPRSRAIRRSTSSSPTCRRRPRSGGWPTRSSPAYPRLDVLLNNVGGFWAHRHVTADGLEHTFALNHLAPFLLTNLLLDRLIASAPARVVTVSSAAPGDGDDRLR